MVRQFYVARFLSDEIRLEGSFLSQMATCRPLISHTGEFSWWIISYKSSWSQLHKHPKCSSTQSQCDKLL